MTQEERWSIRYNEVKAFIEENHRNLSKYNLEEHDMLTTAAITLYIVAAVVF